MSEQYQVIAVGEKEFLVPYALAGLQTREVNAIDIESKVFKKEELQNTVYLLDESVIKDIRVIGEFEELGANITLLKKWGSSDMAENKIKAASIKAMGVDLLKEEISRENINE